MPKENNSTRKLFEHSGYDLNKTKTSIETPVPLVVAQITPEMHDMRNCILKTISESKESLSGLSLSNESLMGLLAKYPPTTSKSTSNH